MPTNTFKDTYCFYGVRVLLSYKNVMLFLEEIGDGQDYKKVEKAFKYLGVDDNLLKLVPDPENFLIDLIEYINKPRFSTYDIEYKLEEEDMEKRLATGQISKEDAEAYLEDQRAKKNVPLFDDMADYDIIHPYFLDKFNIDLDEDDIPWFKYVSFREYMLSDKNPITKRIEVRSFVPEKGKGNAKYNSYMKQVKYKYSLS